MMSGMLELADRSPALQAAAIVGGTLVLEDAATVLTAIAARAGSVRTSLALASLYAGIVLGDLGLYGLGTLSAQVGWTRQATRNGQPHVFLVPARVSTAPPCHCARCSEGGQGRNVAIPPFMLAVSCSSVVSRHHDVPFRNRLTARHALDVAEHLPHRFLEVVGCDGGDVRRHRQAL
jgi:hypothetical protein